MAKTPPKKNDSSANFGFEAKFLRDMLLPRLPRLPRLLSGELSVAETQ